MNTEESISIQTGYKIDMLLYAEQVIRYNVKIKEKEKVEKNGNKS